MEKLNVCLLNDSFPPAIDGVANAVVNYADIITREHGRASVVTPYYPEADDSVFNYPVIRYPSLDLTRLVGYRAGLPFSVETMDELDSASFDIIHSHCPIVSTILARSLRSVIDVPIVMTYHTKFDIDIANAIKSKRLQQKAAEILVENISACDEVWTVSRGAGENLRKLGYKGEYIVMPNGVDFPKGRVSDEAVSEAVEGYDLPSELPCFLFVGRMMWYKGIRITLDALKILKDSGRAFRMVFIGSGNDRDEIIAYSEKLGLNDCCIFIPAIHDRNVIRAWYCRAELFLFPSTFDTNGLVVREAAACSLGSVLVRGSCAAEDSTDAVDSLFIDENAESMAAVLEEVFDKRELMKTIGENACNNLYMSWEASVSAACERYELVIDKYKRGEYSEHEKLSDELLERMSNMLEALIELHHRQETIEREITERRESFRADLIGAHERIEERRRELIEQIERFL